MRNKYLGHAGIILYTLLNELPNKKDLLCIASALGAWLVRCLPKNMELCEDLEKDGSEHDSYADFAADSGSEYFDDDDVCENAECDGEDSASVSESSSDLLVQENANEDEGGADAPLKEKKQVRMVQFMANDQISILLFHLDCKNDETLSNVFPIAYLPADRRGKANLRD